MASVQSLMARLAKLEGIRTTTSHNPLVVLQEGDESSDAAISRAICEGDLPEGVNPEAVMFVSFVSSPQATWNDEYNQKLSERRALSVAQYLES